MRAEAVDDPGPWRQQTVLGRSQWNIEALRDAVLVLDETGFLK